MFEINCVEIKNTEEIFYLNEKNKIILTVDFTIQVNNNISYFCFEIDILVYNIHFWCNLTSLFVIGVS